MPEKITPGEIQYAVKALVDDAVTYVDGTLSPERAEATKYYQGKPFGNEITGRSQIVLTDVRDTVLAMLPSLVRMFFPSSGHVVEYQPRPKSEAEIGRAVALADQATEFVNAVVLDQDNNGFLELFSAWKDALVRKLGTIKYWWEDRSTYKTYTGSRYDVLQYEALVADPDVEVTAVKEIPEPGVVFYDVTYKQWRREGIARVMCAPPEEMLVSRDARNREDASLIAHRTEKTRGELIAMGVPAADIDQYGGGASEVRQNIEEVARRGIVTTQPATDAAAERHLWVEAYPYLDIDGDGEAELVRCRCLGPGLHVVGDPEPVAERPFAFFCPDPEPHVLIGQSIKDRVGDLQKTKSMILRAINDSAAKAIDPDELYQEGEVNAADLASSASSRRIRTYQPPGSVIMEFKHEFVGAELVPLLGYLDTVKQQRVGPMPATLDPDALQSTPEVGVKATVQAASEQLELIARIFAGTGMKQLFKGLLQLLVEHNPTARIVRLRNQYVAVDPKAWDADMDVSVNVALGTQEKLGVLVATAAKQEQILQTLGPTNPLCGIGQLRHTYATLLELQGFRDTTKFFSAVPLDWQPPPQPPQPDPNLLLAQAEMVKAQAKTARDQADFQIAQIGAQQEMAALRAQLVSKEAELALAREGMHLTDERERDKAEAEIALRAAELQAKYPTDLAIKQLEATIAREEMDSRERIAATKGNGEPKGRKKNMTVTASDGRKLNVTIDKDAD